MLLKKGTQVKIIAGKDRGKTGEILEIWDGGQGGDLPSDTIRSLHIDMDGYVWVGTDDGATRFNGQRFNDLDHDGQWRSHRY